MKDFELKTLIFNDGNKFRSFRSSDFNFILDKESGLSICYGSFPEETPTYDPLSPEVIDIKINKNFKFDDELQNIKKLFNINEEKENEFISISTISTINLIINNIYDENIYEIIKLNEYLNGFNIFINLIVSYDEVSELRDVLRLKLFNINNIVIDCNEFKANELLNQVNLMLSKNINVSYYFYISKNNYEEFISLMELGFPGNTFSNIYFKDDTTKTVRNEIVKAITNKGNFTICDTKRIKNNNLNYSLIELYQDSLFKCYIDFDKKIVSYLPNYEKAISFDKIERIDSYWHSKEFEKYRFSLIKDKYEDEKDKKYLDINEKKEKEEDAIIAAIKAEEQEEK